MSKLGCAELVLKTLWAHISLNTSCFVNLIELATYYRDIHIFIANLQLPSKKWNLEDDSDEEDEAKAEGKADEQEEVDPLDAFMQVFYFLYKFVSSSM